MSVALISHETYIIILSYLEMNSDIMEVKLIALFCSYCPCAYF